MFSAISKHRVYGFIAAATLVVTLTGCSMQDSTPTSQPKVAPTETAEVTPIANPYIHEFGQVHEYENGITITVSAPKKFTPSAEASGSVNKYNVYFKITITNNTDDVYEPAPMAEVSSAGEKASFIADVMNPIGEISFPPTTPILAGKTLSWLDAASVKDKDDITYTVSPNFDLKKAIFTSSN